MYLPVFSSLYPLSPNLLAIVTLEGIPARSHLSKSTSESTLSAYSEFSRLRYDAL